MSTGGTDIATATLSSPSKSLGNIVKANACFNAEAYIE